jgi:predicted ATPase
MNAIINKISINGYKSFKDLKEFPLMSLNILIGANGSGKSNFIEYFVFLKEIISKRMQFYVNKKGGADMHLYLGPKETEQIKSILDIGDYQYRLILESTVDNRLVFNQELLEYQNQEAEFKSGHDESVLASNSSKVVQTFYHFINRWTHYHFHDTCENSYIRRQHSIRDYEKLRPDGRNLAAFLYHLKNTDKDRYDLIRDTTQIAAPFFNDFVLRPKLQSNGDEMIELEWAQKNTDYPFHPGQLSDGTLRFISLATALLQKPSAPVMLFDEPELGLHPDALNVLAGLFKQASYYTQIIIATQSATLLNNFDAENVVIINRNNGESMPSRLNEESLAEWLESYTLGELWQKNVFGEGSIHPPKIRL